MNDNTLVIGGGGFIGSAIINNLRNSRLINGTSRGKSDEERHAGLIKLDIFDSTNWIEVLQKFQPKTVICTAWETEHKKYWNKATNKAYSKAIQEFAVTCFSNKVEKFVCLGSMSEYGFSPGACKSGVTQLNPQDLYSETKIQTSIAIRELANKFGKYSLWLRLFQPYGPFENQERLLPSSIKSLINRDKILINFPSHALDFLTVQDTANAVEFILDSEAPNEVDIGSGIPTSVEQVFRILAGVLNINLENIHLDERNRDHERLIYVDPTSEIFIKGWRPTTNLYQGLDNYVKWILENH